LPKRFDTSTNYQLPAYRTFLFAGNKARAQHNIEDGAGNTIMLLEVNDSLAALWTQPTDYDPQNVRQLTDDLGGLREDGTFAAWANGWTVLLANELSDDQLLNSLTYESGDGQVAGFVHRDIYAGIEDNDFLRASAVARMAYRYTGEERQESIPKLLSRLRVLLGTAKREYDVSVDHLRAYREDPSNVRAGASFGMFLCMIKGDWEHGLPLLTKSGPAALQEVARLDIAGARTNTARIAVGDAWWNLSEVARTGAYRQAARDRAVYWYEQAFDSLPDSLDRMHVKSRLDEAEAIEGTSPIAICVQLAEELGVDLSYGLAAIADTGQPRLGAKNRCRILLRKITECR
jgi:hypothetical protein